MSKVNLLIYTDFCKTWVPEHVLGTVPGEEEGEGPAHIGRLCALLFKELHATSLMIFDYGKKKGRGAFKESGQKHACPSFVWFQALLMSLGLLAAFALPAQPNPLVGTAGRGAQWGLNFVPFI